MTPHFDPSPREWFTSLGLAPIIGVALMLNAEVGTNGAKVNGWQRFRFVRAPFYVSSFATLNKRKGFVLVFSPDWREVVLGTLTCRVSYWLGVDGAFNTPDFARQGAGSGHFETRPTWSARVGASSC